MLFQMNLGKCLLKHSCFKEILPISTFVKNSINTHNDTSETGLFACIITHKNKETICQSNRTDYRELKILENVRMN